MKNFELWNGKKIKINDCGASKMYRARDVWWCALGANIGFELDGKDGDFQRPVLIIKGLSKKTCLIVPLTTSPSVNPYRINLGIVAGKESKAIISQIKVIDSKRLINKIAVLEKTAFEEIRKAIKDMLG